MRPSEKARRSNAGRFWFTVLVTALMTAVAFVPTWAQIQIGPDADKNYPIDRARQLAIIDSVTAALNKIYVFPEKAAEMEKFVRKQYADGVYDTIT